MSILTEENIRVIRNTCKRTGDSADRYFQVHGTWFRIRRRVVGHFPVRYDGWELHVRHGESKNSPVTIHPLPSKDPEHVADAVELALCAEVLCL